MTIRIVTDSTCDLPESVTTELGIHVIPMYINFGDKGYLDGVEITRETFYDRLRLGSEHPTTAVASVRHFEAAYKAMADAGADEVLSIHVSSTLSSVVDVARLAAQKTTAARVTVFDSRQLSLGLGYMVEKAARLAGARYGIIDITAVLKDQIPRTHVFAALETLEYVKRSGRINKYLANFATLLQVKPIVHLYDGVPGVERVRTHDRAMKRVVEMLADMRALERVAIVHSQTSSEKIERLRELAAPLLSVNPIWTVNVTPLIGVHLGPGALGFAAVSAAAQSHFPVK